MKVVYNLLLVVSLTALVSCTETEELTALEFGANNARSTKSVDAFATTVHPILKRNCASCHGDGGGRLGIALNDTDKAHAKVVSSGKVNLSSPVNSRLVQRLISDRHNCWGDCAANGAEMQAAIEKWANAAGSDSTTPDSVAKTTLSLKIGDAVTRLPQTENGILILQAEDGELSGRFGKHVHQTASGGLQIKGLLPPPHPIGGTIRTSSISGLNSCREPSNEEINDGSVYRVRENRRHINQSGFSYYNVDLSLRIVKPSMRTAFNNERKSGARTYAELGNGGGNYLLPQSRDNDNYISAAGLSVLPEFTSVAEYVDNIRNANDSASNEIKNFFAPRFGDNSDEYYSASFKEVPTIIDDDFKRGLIYPRVRNAFWRMFFNANYPGGSAKSLSDVPYTLRSYMNGQTRVDYERSNTVARAFFDHYFPLTQNDSVSNTGDDAIDSYVVYNVSADSRDIAENFTHTYEDGSNRVDTFNLFNGNTVTLGLDRFYGNDTDLKSLQVKNFEDTLHPIFKSNCMNCHGDGGNRIKHASSNSFVAYESIISRIDFDSPSDSVPVQQMARNHNCGSNAACDSLEQEMTDAISLWASKNQASRDLASDNPYKAYTQAEKTPGRAKYRVRVTESGRYNVWLKMLTGTNRDSVRIRVINSAGEIVRSSNADANGNVSNSDCRSYDAGQFGDWTWYTPFGDVSAIRNLTRINGVPSDELEAEKARRISAQYERRTFWDLNPGIYTIELIEQDIGTGIDLIALSSNREFHPLDNLKDEGFIQDIEPKILKYDISSLIGSPGFFEIEIKEENEGSFVFRAPKITGNSTNVKVRNIKALVNKQYEFNNSTYTQIDATVGTDGRILTYAPLLTLKVDKSDCTVIEKNRENYVSEAIFQQVYNECLATLSDSFQFGFADLQATNQSPTPIEDDYLGEIENVECRDVSLFVKTVKPILREVRLLRKGTANEDNDGYSQHEFPGDRRDEVSNPTFYQCMGCHNDNHPYFKMTTFGDDRVLCAQALSRVNYLEPEASTILRGLNGYGVHPKLHFAEDAEMNGAKTEFVRNGDGSLKSNWLGMRFEKYTDADINLTANGLSNLDRDFLRKMVGKYKSIRYQRANDPEGDEFGIIVTDRDVIGQDGNLVFTGATIEDRDADRDNKSRGKNLWEVVQPNSLLPATTEKMQALNAPVYGGDRVIMMDRCKDKPIRSDLDECNGNVNFNTEFEVLKEKYRSVIRAWIQSEISKGAFDDL